MHLDRRRFKRISAYRASACSSEPSFRYLRRGGALIAEHMPTTIPRQHVKKRRACKGGVESAREDFSSLMARPSACASRNAWLAPCEPSTRRRQQCASGSAGAASARVRYVRAVGRRWCLRAKGQQRVGGVAEERDGAEGPLRDRVAVVEREARDLGRRLCAARGRTMRARSAQNAVYT